MAFRFKPSDKGITKGLRRIVREQAQKGIAGIDAQDGVTDDLIHDLRKRAKKLRGLIRLVRPALPDYDGENAALRDAARQLADLRNTASLGSAHDALMDRYSDEVERAAFAPLRRSLTMQSRQAKSGDRPDTKLEGFRISLAGLANRTDDWSLDRPGRKAMRAGLEKTLKQARKAMNAVSADPSVENIHTWRKRVKDHWYQTRILSPINPRRMRTRARGLKLLSEYLGDHHDLAMLGDYVRDRNLPSDNAARAAFLALIKRRQDELLADAEGLGAKLFAQPPSETADRWIGRFTDWRK